MGSSTLCILFACEGAQPRVPGQVHGRVEESVPKRPIGLSRKPSATCERTRLPFLSSSALPSRLGRVRQAAVRRSAARASLPGPLHPPRCYLQSPIVDFTDGQVTFRWKDYAHGSKQKLMTVTADEFLRRVLLHVLPHGFVRIRFFGVLANRHRKTLLPLCRQLLCTPRDGPNCVRPATCSRSTWRCPSCGESMILVQRFTAVELNTQRFARRVHLDSS